MYSFAHVGIVVSDINISEKFYTTVLGCKVTGGHKDDRVQLVYLETGNQTIELIKYKEDIAGKRGAGIVDHIAFNVEDMDVAIANLNHHKVSLLMPEPRMAGKQKIIFFAGPDGERLELIQKL